MKRHYLFKTVLLVMLGLAASASAQIEMVQSVVGCGGTRISGPAHLLNSTVGQTAIGVTAGPVHLHQIGFWYQPNQLLTAVDDQTELPVLERWLGENCPNPFNPMTSIEFAVPEKTHVTLRVYDLTGRLVASLVDAEVEAGYHQIIFDGRGLGSGVYICRMVAGDFTQTRKLMLIK